MAVGRYSKEGTTLYFNGLPVVKIEPAHCSVNGKGFKPTLAPTEVERLAAEVVVALNKRLAVASKTEVAGAERVIGEMGYV